MARGKRYASAYEKVERDRRYNPAEAVALVKETASTKFDETVEVHMRLGLNVRHAEEQLRGTLALPNGLGKELTVAVFAEGEGAREATEAGADHVGDKDLAAKVEEGWTDFDVAIATPDLMGPVVSKLGRVLGPQGKMPNPKVGTVTNEVAKAVREAKAGKVEYRTDRQANVHLTIGKASFEERALLENYAAVIDEINRAKPASSKGRYLLSITLATTMGPGVRVDPAFIREGEVLASAAGNGAAPENGAPSAEAPAPPPPVEEPTTPAEPDAPVEEPDEGEPAPEPEAAPDSGEPVAEAPAQGEPEPDEDEAPDSKTEDEEAAPDAEPIDPEEGG